jgi:regulator of protease activity HflC (stomatin/prohibitin superfamily)
MMKNYSANYDEGGGFGRDRRIPSLTGRASVLVAAIVIIVIIVGVLAISGFVQVPSGSRGVLLTFGKVEDKILQTGLNLKMPFAQTVVFMNVQIQKAESTESTATKDLQEISTTIAVNFRLNPSAVNQIYRDLRSDYVVRVIKPNIEESLKATTAQFTAEELITKRAIVKSTFDDILAERISIFNIEVVSVSLTDFQFSPSFSAAIEGKVSAEQEAFQARNKLEQVRYEAQQQIIKAEAEKNATIARALGNAQAQVIKANSTASAISLITSQMTPEYARYLWLVQWDGKLPAVFGGDSQGLMFDISSLTLRSELQPPEFGRDTAVDYVLHAHGGLGDIQAPSSWESHDLTPGLVGASNLQYVGEGWIVNVSYPVVQYPNYSVKIEYSGDISFHWKGAVDQSGNIEELEYSITR